MMEREIRHVCDLETLKELDAKAVEHSPDAIVFASMDGVIVSVNAAAEFMFGYHRNEMLGQPVEMLMPDEVRDRHVRHRDRYAEEPRSRDMGLGMTLTARARSGKTFLVEIKLSPIVPLTGGVYVMTVIRRSKRSET